MRQIFHHLDPPIASTNGKLAVIVKLVIRSWPRLYSNQDKFQASKDNKSYRIHCIKSDRVWALCCRDRKQEHHRFEDHMKSWRACLIKTSCSQLWHHRTRIACSYFPLVTLPSSSQPRPKPAVKVANTLASNIQPPQLAVENSQRIYSSRRRTSKCTTSTAVEA